MAPTAEGFEDARQWKRCRGMNSRARVCLNLRKHKTHRKVGGVWYWLYK